MADELGILDKQMIEDTKNIHVIGLRKVRPLSQIGQVVCTVKDL